MRSKAREAFRLAPWRLGVVRVYSLPAKRRKRERARRGGAGDDGGGRACGGDRVPRAAERAGREAYACGHGPAHLRDGRDARWARGVRRGTCRRGLGERAVLRRARGAVDGGGVRAHERPDGRRRAPSGRASHGGCAQGRAVERRRGPHDRHGGGGAFARRRVRPRGRLDRARRSCGKRLRRRPLRAHVPRRHQRGGQPRACREAPAVPCARARHSRRHRGRVGGGRASVRAAHGAFASRRGW